MEATEVHHDPVRRNSKENASPAVLLGSSAPNGRKEFNAPSERNSKPIQELSSSYYDRTLKLPRESLKGFLDKKGVGALSKGWKKRYFELTEDKINYYHFDEFEKTHKGFINIEDISEVAAKDPQVPGEKWWFFIDTPTRRYDLKTSEEYMMWKWIEGVKSELAKLSNRKVMQQMEQRRQTKQVEASLHEELVKEKQKIEEIKQEWKRDVNHLKRNLFHVSKELKDKDEQIQIWKKKYEAVSAELDEFKKLYLPKGEPNVESSNSDYEVIPIPLEPSKKSPSILTRENSQTFLPLPYDPDHSLEEMQDDLQSLSALLKEAEEEIKQLRSAGKEKDKKITRIEAEFAQMQEQHDLMKQRYVNEIKNLKEQVELANTSKMALEENNIEREKEIQKLRNRLAELPVISNKAPLWVPDWYSDECTSCKITFNLLRRRHHCRMCGNIFCARCSNNFSIIGIGYYGDKPVRVCNACLLSVKLSKQNSVSAPSSRNSSFRDFNVNANSLEISND